MSPRTRRIAFNLVSFALGGILLYLALRNADFGEVWTMLKAASYGWVVPLLAVIMSTMVIRAWRWKLLLDALPAEDGAPGRSVSLRSAFYSLMIGYMVNQVLPRVGEVVRTANLSTQEKRSFSGILGTVVVERILDVIMLVVMLFVAGLLLLEQPEAFDRLLLGPFEQIGARFTPLLFVVLLVAGIAALGAGLLVLRALRRRERHHAGIARILGVFDAFKAGLLSVFESRHRAGLILSTVGMWLIYVFIAYLPFVMFGFDTRFEISLGDAWIVLAIGAIGFLVPAPGGTGSYHYATILALGLLNVPEEPAATYAVFSHAAQVILFVVTGFVCLLLQGSRFSTIRREVEAVEADTGRTQRRRTDGAG